MAKSVFSDDYRRLIGLLVQSRRASDMTQAKLAEALGKPQSYVSKIENFERRLDVLEFCELVNAIGYDPARTLDAFLAGAGRRVRLP